ncbi:DUF3320 domain-containing protein [Leucobacter chromiiresistens]|uniref:AAA domain-containing protein n=1 Tax=Leucobacter chromiiresistens TaxID=1079994 RepID=A0A1H0Z5J9_9MICO|nr:DUF3320 domain-containing protein [Leucobacter chromiiresistens]SDQ22411.1 AAA domain-containing protein [Leucobacter chromiiresistens]
MVETRVLVGQGFDALSAGLQPFITERMSEVLPDVTDWTSVLRTKDELNGRHFESYNPADLLLQLRVLTERLGTLGYPFQHSISRQASNCASELRSVRNRWAHGESFSAAEAYRALDSAEILLADLDASEQRGRLTQLKLQSLTAMQPFADIQKSTSDQEHQEAAAGIPTAPTVGSQRVEHRAEQLDDREQKEFLPPMTEETAKLEALATDVLSYALAHNRIGVVEQIDVHYRGPELRGASVEVESLSPVGMLGDPKILLVDLDGEHPVTLRDVAFELDPARMLALDTVHRGSLRVTLRSADGRVIAELQHPVTILASNQWTGAPEQLGLELIAAFVQPNAAEISKVASETAEILGDETGSATLDGYQSANPERVDEMVKAAYRAMQNRDIRYAEPPASWGLVGQKVRTPEEVLAGRLGTCLDTTLTLAAVLEELGVNSTLWFVPGHVFLGYWRYEFSLDTAAELDASEAINHVGLGAIRLVETTCIPLGESFETATRKPMLDHLPRGASHFTGITDVFRSRENGVLPLPSRTLDEAGEVVVREYRVAAGAADFDYVLAASRPNEATPRSLPQRITQWKNALLDLSLRNRLINYTTRAGHSLAVPQPQLAVFEDLINSGTPVTLVPADRVSQLDRSRGIQSGFALPESARATQLTDRKQVFIDIAEENYAARLRALGYKARTLVEETGANNLYLALGMLRWNNGDRDLRSPLILVPVNLSTASRGQSYRITLDDTGESTPNYCLLERLKVSFGLEIPGLSNPTRDESGIDLAAALAATRKALSEAKLSFTVDDSVDLAILQFAKFRLWKDIDESWDTFASNSLVEHLVHTPTEVFVDRARDAGNVDLDAVVSELPVPADSSQAEAVVDAAAGRTFVLEGPPGTGKSQTITNLLAHSIAQGKKVLFVAEKRAALDVVKQRLDVVGLSKLSLDLHDKGARPAAVRAQIAAAMDAAAQADEASLLAAREANRSSSAALRRYAERLHEPNAFGLSFYEARERILAADESTPTLPVPLAFVRGATPEIAESLRSALRALPESADLARPEQQHPWGFVQLLPGQGTDQQIHAAAREFDIALGNLLNAGQDPKVLRMVKTPEQVEAWATLLSAPRYPLDAVDALRTHLDSGELRFNRDALLQLSEHTPSWSQTVGVECLASDVGRSHAQALAADASGFFGRKRRQRAVLLEFGTALRIDPRTFPAKGVSGLTLEIVRTSQAVHGIVQRLTSLPIRLVPQGWNPYIAPGAAPVVQHLDWLTWLVKALAKPGTFPEPLLDNLRAIYAGSPNDPAAADALRRYAHAWRSLESLLGSQSDRHIARMSDWAGEQGIVDAWISTRGRRHLDVETPLSLHRWNTFLRQLEPLREAGLVEAYEALKTGRVPADRATLAFDKGMASSVLVERQDSQGLTAFDGGSHNRTISRFTTTASGIRAELPRWIPQQVIQQRRIDPGFAGGAMGELKRQLGRKRGGMSVRALFENYESIILQIAPCVLMSPESVARFFPAKAGMFDIVVFDEASQIRVADAVGAMGRGNSVVVVGDSKQMPPTSIAETQINDDLAHEDEGQSVVDEESILTECVQARVLQRWLSWHYRSQDETLISFSNHTYYDSRLSSFPAPLSSSGSADVGISLIRVEGTFNRTGKGKLLRTNLIEAQAIIDEVARRFEKSEGDAPSLGIVTFNTQQRALIEAMLRDHPDERLAAALEERDGLFVKNLENVQGDERDTILFSVAFSANDRGFVPLNFGPLTRAGGERRLNVAITRARRQVILFASFDPDDLRVENTVSVGVKHLKAYMELAARGVQASSLGTAVQPLVDRHRDEIASELRMRGFAVQTDLGLSDFRVDISVATAEHPDRPLVAVLLDGESWRMRRTVADRDGLPVEVLENLMRWPAVERVWLPEWLQDREGALTRLSEAVHRAADQRAFMEKPSPVEPLHDVQPSSSIDEHQVIVSSLEVPPREGNALGVAGVLRSAAVPIVEKDVSSAPGIVHERLRFFRPWSHGVGTGSTDALDALPRAHAVEQVRGMIHSVVQTEGPVHRQRLAKLVGEAFGLSRVSGGRAASILACSPEGLPTSENGNFIWPEGSSTAAYTIARRTAGEDRRDIESVALEEIANAMAIVAELSGGVDDEAIQREALALFGGKRVTAGIAIRLQAALRFAEETSRIRRAGSLWRIGLSA